MTQSLVDAIVEEALPILPVQIDVPDFGCSAFTLQEADGDILMGRNYDFRRDTSAMLVYCEPEDGYKSVGFAALDNISANTPEESMKKKLATLTAPFICLDGMNEKGVSIAVLTLDSEPVHQNTGKPCDWNYSCNPPDSGQGGKYGGSCGASAAVRYVCVQRKGLSFLHNRFYW